MRVAAGASWALWPSWEEEGGGSIATKSSFLIGLRITKKLIFEIKELFYDSESVSKVLSPLF
jgi:hypothetical protein